ncbi:MAG: DUF1800 domain-containing protein [Massilia sp.]
MHLSKRAVPGAIALVGLLAGCATAPSANLPTFAPADTVAVLNRVTWGVNDATVRRASDAGLTRYLQTQLHPGLALLPPAAQAQLAALTISQRPLPQLLFDLEQQRKAADATVDDEAKKQAQQAYQQELSRLAREAASRAVLRALYSPNQLQEQMTWFWMNHFNIYLGKANLRAMVGDFEEQAVRPHALGKFRELLSATVHHPAMLRYLDNEQNALNHLNENFARELMELHTLGVDGGYSQRDVQELARMLTGLGVNQGPTAPSVRRELQPQYLRAGLFEFNPNRHDYGAKQFLGQPVQARGLAEVDEAIDRLSRHPATAHFVCRKLAQYFVADDPSPALVERMAQTFLRSEGDIALTMQTLLAAPEFAASLGHKFKDPLHYAVSAVRLAYDEKTILNTGPLLNWLNRMGEPLYGRQTPDGYPLSQAAWASSGQMTTRFEIAKAIGSGNAGLFKTDGPQPVAQPAFPQLANALFYQALQAGLGAPTRDALDHADSPQEWNTFLLSAPEMMFR